MDRGNFGAYLDFIEQHEASCGDEITPSDPDESGRRFTCAVCGAAFVLNPEGCAIVARLKKCRPGEGRRLMGQIGKRGGVYWIRYLEVVLR